MRLQKLENWRACCGLGMGCHSESRAVRDIQVETFDANGRREVVGVKMVFGRVENTKSDV